MPRKKIRRDKDDLLGLTPTDDFRDPGKNVSGGKRRRVYTSGTLYEKETGRYSTPGMSGSLDKIYSHGKKATPNTGTWNAVTAAKGTKARGAQRGVGKETLDGYKPPKKRKKR